MEVTLRNTSAVAVIDTKGAELKSFQDGFGTEYMWQADPKYWGRTSPVLFPIVGNLRNNRTIIQDKEYEIPKHGLLRDAEFRLLYHSDEKAIFSYIATEETKAHYPFDFQLQMTYSLDGCDLEVKYDVFNLGKTEMPFCLGAHPAFNIPVTTEDTFDQYYIRFDKEMTTATPVYDLEHLHWINDKRITRLENTDSMKLDYDLFEEAIFFDEFEPSTVTISSQLTGRGVKVDMVGFPTVAFWTPANKQAPFLCVEPWCGSAVYDTEDDEFLHKRDVQILSPDEKKSFCMTIHML